MQDQTKVVMSLKAISDRNWAEKKYPLLLSALPRILEEEVPDYRTVLGPCTLKRFIKETGEAAGYKLVEHPTQRARVGIAPAATTYEFPPEPSHVPKPIAAKSNQEVTLAFFRALATLPDSDLDKLIIPASVIVKLLK